MANQWLRLWHDMPTDPKWRTIARVSGQRIGDVMAVYMHLLVCGSNATERGRTQSFNSEDVATALDIETEQVESIIAAMQGRVLDGDLIAGWEKRQVAREDGSAERAKQWREEQKARKREKELESNATERERTQSERNRAPDKDKDKEEKREEEKKEEKASRKRAAVPSAPSKPDDVDEQTWSDWLALRKSKRAAVTETVLAEARKEAGKAGLPLGRFLAVWCIRGSQGLQADWLRPTERGVGPPETPGQDSEAARRAATTAEAKRMLFGSKPHEVIDA